MGEVCASLSWSLEGRQDLIKTFPCFASFTSTQVAQLAELMTEMVYAPQEIIVKENDIVDAVYIILKGEAEATRITTIGRVSQTAPIALLRMGEGIGLNDTGFYSPTGKRTATVTALTQLRVLRLELKDLYQFLQDNNLEVSMSEASLQMLRMKFIKQSLPFAKLSHERLQWLVDHIEEEMIPAGTTIFSEGEKGEKCYLIRSGKVEIVHLNEHGEEKKLATLQAPVLFGEATMITRSPRNATAYALEDCDLLVLNHEYLSELIESEEQVANMFMHLMVDRSRPKRNPKVTVHQQKTADGQEITILKNTENGNYFKLSTEGNFIWQLLDGKHSMQDITLDLAEQHNVFAPDIVAGLISKLSKAGYITNLKIQDETQLQKQPFWVKAIINVRNILEYRYAFGKADQWVTKMYNKYVWYFFTKPAVGLLLLLAVIGIGAFAFKTPHILNYFMENQSSLFLLLALIPFNILEVIFHELGHAFAVKAFGREVHYIGVGWYWTAPVAFTDTTDMWLATRKQRMLVNLAGVFVDIILGSLAAILVFLVSNPYVQILLWLFAAFTFYGAFKMLSPLQELDGYYVLMDWLEKNRLRQSAVLWLMKGLPLCIRKPHLIYKKYWAECCYWLACIIYIILTVLLIVTVLSFIFALMGKPLNLYVSLGLPLLVILLSSLGIIADIKNQKDD